MASADQLGVGNVLEVVEGLFGMGGTVRHDEFVTLCPVHDDSHPPEIPKTRVKFFVNSGEIEETDDQPEEDEDE